MTFVPPKCDFYNSYPLSYLHLEIFDVMIEGQQFELLGFTLSPVIRMAIMKKVSDDTKFKNSPLIFDRLTLMGVWIGSRVKKIESAKRENRQHVKAFALSQTHTNPPSLLLFCV